MALWLYSIGIDEVRDIFGADKELAARLRGIIAETFRQPEQPRSGRLRKLFAGSHRDKGPVIDAALPTAADVDALLRGCFIPPDRLTASWLAIRTWLNVLSWGTAEYAFTPAKFDSLEFVLARTGVPSQFSIGSLLANDAQLPILPPRGTCFGYSKHSHVLEVRAALKSVVDDLPAESATQVTALLGFLEQYPSWAAQSGAAARPFPDLLVIWEREPS